MNRKQEEVVIEGTRQAFSDWIIFHDVTVPEAISEGVRQALAKVFVGNMDIQLAFQNALGSWLDRHSDEVESAIENALKDKLQ